MTIKPTLNTVLSLIAAAVILYGCSSNTEFSNADKYAKIYMPQAQEYPAEHSLVMTDSVQTIIYGANYGGPGSPKNDIDVHFSVDSSLIDSFNTANGTSYAMMPEGSYELSKTMATISAGEYYTSPLALRITTIGAIQPVTKYLLPLTIESNSNVEINADLQTTFFAIEGNYVEFFRADWKIDDVDSQQEQTDVAPPSLATNILDGDPVTFWHTEWNPDHPPMPHHVTVDMGESQKVHGLRIIGREGFTRGDPEAIVIFVSSDGENWSDGEEFTTKFNTQNEETFYLSTPVEGSYFKLKINKSYGADNPPITHIAEAYAF